MEQRVRIAGVPPSDKTIHVGFAGPDRGVFTSSVDVLVLFFLFPAARQRLARLQFNWNEQSSQPQLPMPREAALQPDDIEGRGPVLLDLAQTSRWMAMVTAKPAKTSSASEASGYVRRSWPQCIIFTSNVRLEHFSEVTFERTLDRSQRASFTPNCVPRNPAPSAADERHTLTPKPSFISVGFPISHNEGTELKPCIVANALINV